MLTKTCGCVRFVYDRILKICSDAYYKDSTSINYSVLSKILANLRKDPKFVWLKEVASLSPQ
ncbi:helix-turn-helix domain-containing protein [Psychromonas ingrahamii]|uniref:helix-turn-helix domain-containing protein n=1 Tax=Psychromonas ingrahamii TaxID=357794 RepID=UPI0018DDF7E3